jgi:hypothetical protein
MSLPRPICPYHFHADLIWWDGPFKVWDIYSHTYSLLIPRTSFGGCLRSHGGHSASMPQFTPLTAIHFLIFAAQPTLSLSYSMFSHWRMLPSSQCYPLADVNLSPILSSGRCYPLTDVTLWLMWPSGRCYPLSPTLHPLPNPLPHCASPFSSWSFPLCIQ